MPINDLFLKRWSPRAMSGKPLTLLQVQQLVEAARWAPSSYNNQPWRYFYAISGDEFWTSFVDLLAPGNKIWAEKAGALFVVAAKTTFDYNNKPSRTAPYDTGAATLNLAYEGFFLGLVVHQMEGFDYDKAHELLKMPKDFVVQSMVAVGFSGDVAELPKKAQQDEHPNERRPLDEIMFHGTLK